ncbi:MAG: 30S ribosomal protein S17e [Nanoarchaeota archaeon]|nr:30S ribosomal protein S17e [Nanoarchaeota archaeon]
MGKIKSKSIRKSTSELQKKGVEFAENFKDNKTLLGGTMPSKKLRNQMAGYLVRVKKQEKLKQESQK